MIPTRRESGQVARTCETLRDYLLRHGPATAQELLGILALSRAATYQVIRRAASRGLIRAVAHVHSDGNHDPLAWDIDSEDGELLWRRSERLQGRFCTCLPKNPRTRRNSVS
ncbi:MAG: TrmB family transcriptional regulator [Methanobacteriota archaeon]|nr:MAG: TrmB family transcriptional regulator [Euryarchaeota archaeon]